jgi:hypothetical protein
VSAQQALNRIVESPEGAQAVVDAKLLDFLPGLRDSRRAEVRKWTAEILEALVSHGFAFGL